MVKKRQPNPALLGKRVKTFPNKKGLVRRMTMIQSALDRYDPREYFTKKQKFQNNEVNTICGQLEFISSQ